MGTHEMGGCGSLFLVLICSYPDPKEIWEISRFPSAHGENNPVK